MSFFAEPIQAPNNKVTVPMIATANEAAPVWA